jgi:hypothetical protein
MVNNLPSTIIAGETFRAQICAVADSVTFYLRGPAAYTVTTTATGDTWQASQATAEWEPGTYAVEAWAVNAVVCGETIPSYLVARTRINVEASAVSGGAAFNALNKYEQIVTAIETHLAGNGSDPTWRSYKINNREIARHSVPELLQLLAHYKRLAAIERRKQRGQSILGPDIRFRF